MDPWDKARYKIIKIHLLLLYDNVDGNKFVANAIQAGAATCIVNEKRYRNNRWNC